MNILSLFFSFTGRINRTQFWLATLAIVIIDIALVYLLVLNEGLTFSDYLGATTPQILRIDSTSFGLLFWPSLAIGYKRLHDRGRSGKIYGMTCLALLLLSAAGAMGLFSQKPEDNLVFIISLLLLLIVFLYFLVEMGFLKGDPAGNSYGPPPV